MEAIIVKLEARPLPTGGFGLFNAGTGERLFDWLDWPTEEEAHDYAERIAAFREAKA